MSSIKEDTTVIHLWCGPRSLSTCTMYSFAQRPDTKVIDEPLYAHWLHKNPQIYRPYRNEMSEKQNTDGNAVLKELLQFKDKKVLFLKQIARQYLPDLDDSLLFTPNSKHVFMLRDPLEMISAWNKVSDVHQEECSLDTMSLPLLTSLYSKIRRNTGTEPIVVDSNLLASHPRETLTELCRALNIPFYEEQLSWPVGPKPDIDGLWASHWYETVHASSGFNNSLSSAPKYAPLTPTQIELYREALPFYDLLRRKAIGRDPLNPGSSVNLMLKSTSTSTSTTSIIDHGLVLSTGGGSGDSFASKRQKLGDKRNEDVLAWVGDRLVPREMAKLSVFDSAVQGGDAVWEGLRVYDHSIFRLEEHLDRLFDSSKAMLFENVPSREFVKEAIFRTLSANGMTDGAHMRLTLSRGPKITSSMNPLFNVFGCCLVVLAEWKPVGDAATYDNTTGIRLVTSSGRRNSPQCVDSKIHHCNLINNILPKIQANQSNAADALMLDIDGFVSETNATNVFMIKDGKVSTPSADYCLPGITRSTVISICAALSISCVERRISLAEFHAADVVFTTGTMGELTPVYEIDGRSIAPSNRVQKNEENYEGTIFQRIQKEYRFLTKNTGYRLPF